MLNSPRYSTGRSHSSDSISSDAHRALWVTLAVGVRAPDFPPPPPPAQVERLSGTIRRRPSEGLLRHSPIRRPTRLKANASSPSDNTSGKDLPYSPSDSS